MGKRPGFKPNDNSQLIAPTQGLQTAMTAIYSLKHYLPTLMHVAPCNTASQSPLYYSLAHPTLLDGAATPYNRNSSTILFDLRDLKLLISIFLEHLNKNHAINHQLNFDYFHVESDHYDEIKSSKTISEYDSSLLNERARYPDRVLCTTSPFWRGCVGIKSK